MLHFSHHPINMLDSIPSAIEALRSNEKLLRIVSGASLPVLIFYSPIVRHLLFCRSNVLAKRWVEMHNARLNNILIPQLQQLF